MFANEPDFGRPSGSGSSRVEACFGLKDLGLGFWLLQQACKGSGFGFGFDFHSRFRNFGVQLRVWSSWGSRASEERIACCRCGVQGLYRYV